MKKIIFIFWMGLISAVTCSAKEEGWPLVKEGGTECSIVLPEGRYEVALPGPQPNIKYAAQFLQEYVMKVSGVKVPIVKKSEASSKYRIYLGPTEKAKSIYGDLAKLEPEEFIIKSVADGVVICGEVSGEKLSYLKGTFLEAQSVLYLSKDWEKVDRGTLFGVYEFIERVLGVRFYFPGEIGTIIPRKNEIYVPEMDIRKFPFLQSRIVNLWIRDARQWHAALRGGNSSDTYLNHTEWYWPELYGQTHPEYFALKKDGARDILKLAEAGKVRGQCGPQCLSEPGVLAQKLKDIEYCDQFGNVWDERPWKLWAWVPTKKYVYFMPNDGNPTCYCPRCKELSREDAPFNARYSEVHFDFVSRYANEIKKHWPGRRLMTAAYATYTILPEKANLPENVDILLCLFYLPPMGVQNQPANYAQVSKVINDFYKALGNDRKRLFIWDYTDVIHSGTDAPLFYPHVIARRYKEGKTNGGFLETMDFGGRYDKVPNRVNLQNAMLWLWCSLMWEPDLNIDKALDEFCADMFGKASRTMKKFFDLQIARYENTKWKIPDAKLGCMMFPDASKIYEEIYPRKIVIKLENLIKKALNEVPEDSIEHKRITWFYENYKPFFEGSYDPDKFEYIEIPGGETGFGHYSDDKSIVFRLDQEVGYKEKGSLLTVSDTVGGMWYSKLIPISGDGVYKASVMVKTDEAMGAVYPSLKFYDEKMQRDEKSGAYGSGISGTNDWTELSVACKAPPDAKYVRIELSVGQGKVKAWFDEIKLKRFSEIGNP